LIRLVSDVHGAVGALRRVARGAGTLLILGDLINFIDYRTNSGILADVAGRDFVDEIVGLRSTGDFAAAGEVWRGKMRGREDEYRRRFSVAITVAYEEICAPLVGVDAYVTYGNVDNPDIMQRLLPETARFIEAERIELEGQVFGIVGGGVPTVNSPGEVEDDVMAQRLAGVGPVDVLCTHVAPAVSPLSTDVVGGRAKGSEALRRYIEEHQPRTHYFGDIHQPQAVSWTIGRTKCVNIGYFRATGRAFVHHAG